MPKKRHSNLYTKPPSTVHHSLSSSSVSAQSATSRSNQDVATRSVNELLASLRREQAHPIDPSSLPVVTPTLPGQIREILDLPETPLPRPRGARRRIGLNGRPLPPGPAPPISWMETSRLKDQRQTDNEGVVLEQDHLPGIEKWPSKGSLVDISLKQMVQDWDFHENYDQHYLATLPTRMRMILLSYIAAYGRGVTSEGLNRILKPIESLGDFGGNDDFQRVDLAGSIGCTFQLKSLTSHLLTGSQSPTEEADAWDSSSSLHTAMPSTKITSLRYLSLANPSKQGNYWPSLLKIATNLATLTHLSLANWPKPQLTPNSTTASIVSRHTRPLDYSATGFYAHSLDNDWSEAAGILRRLSIMLYGLEWLDLDGCSTWWQALFFIGQGEPGIDWASRWGSIQTLQLRSRVSLAMSSYEKETGSTKPIARLTADIIKYKQRVVYAMETERHIREQRSHSAANSSRTSRWVEVLKDDFELYDEHLTGQNELGTFNREVEIRTVVPMMNMGSSAWD